ncbi:tRNA intron endonuclease [Russula brevipes]|nr:tRNA intron endonuclease [Russula brevipes]
MANRIPIHVSNHTAFVWDVDHVATLRSQHRVCGVLSGTLPHLSQQNVFLGLPLVLTPEELVLLVEKQLATIVHDPSAHHAPTPAQLEAWDASRQQDIAHQLARLDQRKGEDRVAAAAPNDAETATIQQKRAEREARRRLLPSNAVYTVSVPTSSDAFPWYASGDGDSDGTAQQHTYDTLDAARAAGVWSYPVSAEDRARCEVFRDLWEKGYYMGGGSKFGGDWLVYPGDPLRYHSHFVATVQPSPSAPLRPMEIVAHGRLGTATKKAHLLCGWDPVSREVTYISVEWAGFG